MSKQSVFCLATSRTQAELIVEQLHAENYSNQAISVLFPDRWATRDYSPLKEAPSGAGADAPHRIGGALGWVAGMGPMTLPDAGLLIAGGPVVAAMNGLAPARSAAGLGRVLAGLGLADGDARRYEVRVKQGSLLIAVHADRPPELARAKDIFLDAGAQDICWAAGAREKPAESASVPAPGSISANRSAG
jgi:hypothetical protein